MMKSVMAIGVIMVVLSAANLARSKECGIVNPSFEVDHGGIENIAIVEPNGWSVDMSGGKFFGYIDTYTRTGWATDGSYSLEMYSNKAQFLAGEMATVAQEIDLSDTAAILFDVKLDTASAVVPWDPNVCRAVILIDGDVVWESNSVGKIKGEYLDQVYVVEHKYRTTEPHTLAFGMRINQNIPFYLGKLYITQWDMFECSLCPGLGVIEGDIDGDCCVDANDLKLLADLWLSDGVDPNDPANLSGVGDDLTSYATIDFRDFANYAAAWPGDMIGMEAIAAYWLGPVDPDYEYNLFHGDDIRPRAAINFFDLAVLAETWLGCSGAEDGP